MTRFFAALALAALVAAPAHAALAPGAKAPSFVLPAALGGKDFTYDLAAELKKGPAVVYFYPKAFTSGCSAEAHEFAENMDNFKSLGAGVVGVSGDKMDALKKFSAQDCASKFPVAGDPKGEVIAKYDVSLGAVAKVLGMDHASNRTSFLVAPDGTVIAAYTAGDASKHVSTMLEALKTWRAAHKA